MKKLTRSLLALVSGLIGTSTFAAPPVAPQNLQQAWLITETLLLWDELPDATGYNVYRSDDTNTAWALVASGVTAPRWRDATWQFLPSLYVVTAANADGEGPASDPATVGFAEPFTISVDEPQPGAGTLSPTNAVLGLATSDVNGGQGLVDWGLDATNFTGFLLNTNYLGYQSFALTNLTPRTVYFYRLTSVTSNRAGVNHLGVFTTPDTNHPPFAADWTYPWPMPTNPVSLILQGYDSNTPPLALTFRIVSQATNGTLSGVTPSFWNANEAWVSYTPLPGARGADHFQFVVNNGVWDSAPALVTLTNWFNTLPLTTNGSLTTAEDTAVALTLPAFDAEGDPVTFEIYPWSAWNGTVSGTPPNLVFTPGTNFNGYAWFWYRVSDGYGTANGSFAINVTPVNDRPVIRTEFMPPMTVWEDQSKWFSVQFTDMEWDSTYELIQISGPTNGSVSLQGTQFFYSPPTNFSGLDSLTIAVREADGTTSDPVTLSLEVLPVNDPPVALDQNVSTLEDTPVVITPTATDIDSPPVFTFRVRWLGDPAHGWVEETGTNFIYHPATNFYGTDEFQFDALDDQGWSSWPPGTIHIQVAPVSDLPAVTGLRRRTFSDDVVRLWWNPVPGAASYRVYRADGTNAPFTLLASGVAATNFNDPTAQHQHAYWYQVSTWDGAAEGPASASVFAFPDSTGLLTLDQSYWPIHALTGSVQFVSSIIGGTEGVFEYGTNRSYGVFLENTNLLPFQRFALSNLTPATVYYFRITATDAKGNAIEVSTNYYQDWFTTETWPLATAQSVSTTEDTALNITLAGVEPNYTFHPLTYSLVSGAAHGTLTSTGPNTYRYLPATNYNGGDSFTFKVSNGELDSAPATVSLNVTAVNDLPVAANISATVAEDVSATVPAQFTDVEGGTFTVQIITQPAHGFAGVSGTNLLYLSATNYFGADSFTYRVSDGYGIGNTATVALTVTNVNDAPVATPQSVTTAEDTVKLITPTGADADGNALTVQVLSSPLHGALAPSGTNLLYTPAANYNGADSFTFRVSDGVLVSATATISITVTPVNDRPAANGQSASTAEDTAKAITLTGSDVDGNSLTYTVASSPAHGALTGSGPARTYTPALNYNGPDSFTFSVNDGMTNSATATVSITVTAVNDAPVANALAVTLNEDTATNLVLTGSDVEGGALTFAVVVAPANGVLTGPAPNLTYTPNTHFNGGDSFQFSVSDGTLQVTNTVSLTVSPVNDAPVAAPLSLTTDEDWSVAVMLTASDMDGDALTFSVVTPPAQGTLSGSGANLTYTPAANYNGPDSFSFKANDGSADSAPATVSLTVNAVNDAPVAHAQTMSTPEDTAVAIVLTGSDVENGALTFTVVAGPTHGTLSGSGANLTYTPAANYHGSDSFTFQANDGAADSAPATVSITVLAVNDAPVANALAVTLNEDTATNLVLTGSDVEGGALTFAIVAAPTNGGLTGTAPNLTYTPNAHFNGGDTIVFSVSDGSLSSTGVVTLTVTPVNDAPVAQAQTVSTPEDTAIAIVLTGSDVENGALTFTVVAGPTHGTLSGSGANLTYTPAANYHGSDSFTFQANDGAADSAPATVPLSVTPVNDAPVANAQNVNTREDTAVAITLVGTDVETTALAFSVLSLPTHGTLSSTNAQTVTYTPAANYNGPDSFDFRVSDGTNISNATVSINLTAVNDAPVANPQSVTATYNTAKTITLTGSDVEGSALTYSIVNGPTNGTLSGTAPNLTYTPATGSAGADRFTFRANDGGSNSTAATVSITTQNPAAISTAPTALTVTVPTATGTLILNWSCTATNEDGFKIERSLSSGSGWSQIATMGINIHTFTNTGLTSNTRYYYRVRSYNWLGNSTYSTTVNARAR